MSDQITIAAAGNTVVPAYLTLLQGGYAVHCDRANTSHELWHAENETAHVVAEDLLALLALTAILESREAG